MAAARSGAATVAAAAAGGRCSVFRPRIALHQAVRRSRSPAAAVRNWRGLCRSGRTRRTCAPCSCCRACSRRRSGDRRRASSPHRAGGDIHPRSRRASPCGPPRPRPGLPPSCRPRPRRRARAARHCPAAGRISRSRCVSDGEVVVSTRNTTEASSPLAPCTVMTRTSSREISMSRFTSVSAARSQAINPCSEAGALRS